LKDHDVDGAIELKLVRGGTFNPAIMEKNQVLTLLSEGLVGTKIRDIGLHNKFVDIVLCRKKYLVLVWADDEQMQLLLPTQELFEQSWKRIEIQRWVVLST